jgi:hypothetical protein
LAVYFYRAENQRDGGRRDDHIKKRPLTAYFTLAAEQVGDGDKQGPLEFLKAVVRDYLRQFFFEIAQLGEAVAGQDDFVNFEQTTVAHKFRHFLRSLSGGVQGTDDGTGAGAGHDVGVYARFMQRFQHADVRYALGAPAR